MSLYVKPDRAGDPKAGKLLNSHVNMFCQRHFEIVDHLYLYDGDRINPSWIDDMIYLGHWMRVKFIPVKNEAKK